MLGLTLRDEFRGKRLKGAAIDRRLWRDSMVMVHARLRLAWSNFATVVPGKLYRSNHPTPGRLERLHARFGVRTLVNLRGKRDCGSDGLSRDAAARLGIDHLDMAFESRGAPHRAWILRFYEMCQTMGFPALILCKFGADRGGLALLFEGGTAAEALGQLALRFGHIGRSPTGVLDAFFMHYPRMRSGRMGLWSGSGMSTMRMGCEAIFAPMGWRNLSPTHYCRGSGTIRFRFQ